MKGKLSPEGEVIAAYDAAMVAAFQVLINCLEENDALLPGQFPEAVWVHMEMVKSTKGTVSYMPLAVLHEHSDGYRGLAILPLASTKHAAFQCALSQRVAQGAEIHCLPLVHRSSRTDVENPERATQLNLR
jgi:hypothetical protein